MSDLKPVAGSAADAYLMRYVALEQANNALSCVVKSINRTPTGPKRAGLCDAQIHLLAAIDIMKAVM